MSRYMSIYEKRERNRLMLQERLEKPAIRSRQYRLDNPEKCYAQRLAYKYVSVEGRVCERCGSGSVLNRHHVDYSNPVDVTILCKSCHGKLHGLSGV